MQSQDLTITAATPFVKWAGGKGQLLPELDEHIPRSFARYFEPFLGGGALFFHLASTRQFTAYLSDANEELANAYSMVKNRAGELIILLEKHGRAYRRDPASYYYNLRSAKLGSRIEMAARFIALNKTCYNGLYRVNRSGDFNVPMGMYKNPTICDGDRLRNASAALNRSRARITACDYRQALKKAQEGDFVYLDPPFYPLSATANFVDYTREGFGEKDQVKLAKTFRELDKKKCIVLLSNSDTRLTKELYSDFEQHTVRVNRAISCKGLTRTGYSELLVRNYK